MLDSSRPTEAMLSESSSYFPGLWATGKVAGPTWWLGLSGFFFSLSFMSHLQLGTSPIDEKEFGLLRGIKVVACVSHHLRLADHQPYDGWKSLSPIFMCVYSIHVT